MCCSPVNFSCFREIPEYVEQFGKSVHQTVQAISEKITLVVSILWNFVQQAIDFAKLKIVHIDGDPRLRQLYQERVAGLEKQAVYPLGTDGFRIDHGSNYFQFFDRQGTVAYRACLDNDRVTAVGCGIRKKIPFSNGTEKECCYLCDLKVDPEYRGRHIPIRLFVDGLLNYFKAPRGFGISRNPPPPPKKKWRKSHATHGTQSLHNSC